MQSLQEKILAKEHDENAPPSAHGRVSRETDGFPIPLCILSVACVPSGTTNAVHLLSTPSRSSQLTSLTFFVRTNRRPYACNRCGKAFKWKSSCVKHSERCEGQNNQGHIAADATVMSNWFRMATHPEPHNYGGQQPTIMSTDDVLLKAKTGCGQRRKEVLQMANDEIDGQEMLFVWV